MNPIKTDFSLVILNDEDKAILDKLNGLIND